VSSGEVETEELTAAADVVGAGGDAVVIEELGDAPVVGEAGEGGDVVPCSEEQPLAATSTNAKDRTTRERSADLVTEEG
jgi:hypothetical protein